MPWALMQPFLWVGTGSPEGVLVADRGAAAYRTDGGVGTTLYIKEASDGFNTGWTAVAGGGGGGPATELDADSTILAVDAIANGTILQRSGTSVVGTVAISTIATAQSTADAAGALAATVGSDLDTHEALTTGAHGMTAFGAGLVNDADAATARTTLGLATIASSGSAADLASGTIASARYADNTIALARLVDIAAGILGRASGSGAPALLTSAQATALLDVFTSGAKGLVPASGGGTVNFLRADGTFALPPSASGCSLTRIGGSSGAAGADLTFQRLTSNAAANATTSLVTVMTTTGLTAGLYRFTYAIIYQSSVTTTGVSFAVNYTGTSGSYVHTLYFTSTGGAAATGIADQDTATVAGQLVEGKSARAKNTIGSATAGVDTINSNMLVVLEGLIETTGNGDLELRHASETANSTQVMAQSCLELRKVA